MCNINPIFIPRSYLVEEALEQAANENLEDFNQLLQVVQNPYQENTHLNHLSQPAKKSQSQITTYCETRATAYKSLLKYNLSSIFIAPR